MAESAPDRSDRIRAVAAAEDDYPAGLRDLRDAPARLFVRGRIPPRERAVAIVGSRASTPYGERVARGLAADLALDGFAIVSGLARGIDAAAHRGALEAGGWTVAVLPGGLDAVTPPHHRPLAEEIAAAGGLATEWESGPPSRPGLFIRRNRLIAALVTAVVVVEAAEHSGALSTARFARELGRALFAVPGDVDRPASRGTLSLLRGGARVCAGADDVREVFAAAAPPEERQLLAAVDRTPRAAEELARRSGLALERTLELLLRLEWSGRVASQPGARWIQTPAESA